MCPDKPGPVILASASLALLLAMIASSALAQSSTYLNLAGKVALETEDGKPVPVSGALIDVYRLDSGGHWSALTDRSGHYTIVGLSNSGTYIIIASGPGMRFLWANKVELRKLHMLDFIAMPGDGRRPALKEVKSRIAAGESRQAGYPTLDTEQVLVVKSVYTKAERMKAFERVRFEAGSEEAIKYMERFVGKAPPSDARSSEVRASLESLRK
jgi:hypothetical protein